MHNAAVKTGGRYTLKIVRDDDAQNPRKDRDNLGKMICWHRDFRLGDKHGFDNSDELLAELARHTLSENEIIAYVKNGKADGLKLKYNGRGREWELKSRDDYSGKWFVEGAFPATLPDNYTLLSESILENLRTRDLMNLAERTHLIAPLYFYDHSIQSISMRSFRGRAHHAEWDSGVVGFVYAGHADIVKEYGDASPENIEKARELLNAKVETYDCYLRGECYGYLLYEDGAEIDSCFGFLGGFDEAKTAIRGYIPDDAAVLIDEVRHGDDDPEYDPDDGAEAV
jgi:hypothetical protein